MGLALLNEKDKHYTEAYDGINNLIEQYPDSAMAYAARGGIEKERGMLELAEYDYAKAMSLDEDNQDYRINHIDLFDKPWQGNRRPTPNWRHSLRKV